MESHRYVPAKDELHGKHAAALAEILDMLIEAEGTPVPMTQLLEESGMGDGYSHAITVGMHALELAGVVNRFTYVESGARKPRVAYALTDSVEVS